MTKLKKLKQINLEGMPYLINRKMLKKLLKIGALTRIRIGFKVKYIRK